MIVDNVIVAPVSVYDVQTVLQTTKRDVTSLCLMDNVNPYSVKKPIDYQSVDVLEDEIYALNGYYLNRTTVRIDLFDASQDWTRIYPTGYYRLHDFNRYYHWALPNYTFSFPANIYADENTLVDFPKEPTIPIGDSVSYGGLQLTSYYLGIAIFIPRWDSSYQKWIYEAPYYKTAETTMTGMYINISDEYVLSRTLEMYGIRNIKFVAFLSTKRIPEWIQISATGSEPDIVTVLPKFDATSSDKRQVIQDVAYRYAAYYRATYHDPYTYTPATKPTDNSAIVRVRFEAADGQAWRPYPGGIEWKFQFAAVSPDTTGLSEYTVSANTATLIEQGGDYAIYDFTIQGVFGNNPNQIAYQTIIFGVFESVVSSSGNVWRRVSDDESAPRIIWNATNL